MSRVVRNRPNVAGALAGWIWLAVIIGPIYYILVTSLRPQADYFGESPLSWPSHPTLAAYGRVLDNGFAGFFLNSVTVTAATVALTLAVSIMAAYVITHGRGRFGREVFRLALLGIAIPIQAAIIPVYYLIVQLGLYDSLAALILPSVAFAIPITLLILTNFLRDVPRSLFESMRLDGAGEWTILLRLVLPMSRPALAAVGVYNALQVWNGFLFPLVLTQSADTRVLPLSLWSFKGEFAIDVPAVLAAVVLSVLPMLAAYVLTRRQLVSGMTAGFGR
ncbi:carbohydrate ABC transporter permease [Stackebrandtia nassauensis]|uniref:Binding-protein-dependent transport systems inner membrane component n=1 Tax=Stackebrandtia nassauensis (strain DSM 44728 / CIP 108903 / NRRL B-16338 / NBRC 102104 / LLR-40K-21) TaxID=446470 RepID=D3QBN7_STANL|nr:carbohydrate ABC transporter permease [Stackebrandtia nassauensis]ADD42919.1 binding-protein-dependent transport systems inner membrane component [Stackebrandtia nassauensis DSM 44728]